MFLELYGQRTRDYPRRCALVSTRCWLGCRREGQHAASAAGNGGLRSGVLQARCLAGGRRQGVVRDSCSAGGTCSLGYGALILVAWC